MRKDEMRVSPRVFSEMQAKAAEYAVSKMITPEIEFDRFAVWAHKMFGCVYHTEYNVVVVWEWGNLWRWQFPQKQKGQAPENPQQNRRCCAQLPARSEAKTTEAAKEIHKEGKA
jgi:hypothetical protein